MKRAAIAVASTLLILFLARPGAERLRGKITRSIGQAIGQRVEIGSVHLRFLPRPGFELQEFVIEEQPAFGSEPLLRAADVMASLRLSAMFRGRLEISSLSLSDPSLNLARDAQGRLNIQPMLERTNQSLTAPTAAKQAGPDFPYIEATGARINFKAGLAKTHFALTDARFGLWQESENTWGMRMQARPLRTDANLTDIGQISIEGNWQRAPVLRETPVQLSFEWKQAQAGQLSKLIYGSDKGWRGDVLVSGSISGTPERLQLALDSSVDDFRRFDVLGGGSLRLAGHCAGSFDSVHTMLTDLDCSGPAGGGSLEIKGSASGSWLSSRRFSIVAAKVPAESLLSFAQHVGSYVPEGLQARGRINAMLTWAENGASEQEVNGNGVVENLQLISADGKKGVIADRVPFSTLKPGMLRHTGSDGSPGFEIGPVKVPFGRPAPLEVRAIVSRAGYEISLRGDARIAKLQDAAKMVGVDTPSITAEGAASIELSLAGGWNGDQPARPLGTMQLHSVLALVHGFNAPVLINSASLSLEHDNVQVQNLSASAAQTTWHGAMKIPRKCPSASDCKFEMNLRTAELDAAAFNGLINPNARPAAWYKVLTSLRKPLPYLLQARGAGKLTIDKLVVGNTVCSHFTSEVTLDSGQLTLSRVSGEILGGTAAGKFKANFRSDPATFSGTGLVQAISLGKVAELMHDGWISGEGMATFQFDANGMHLPDIIRSADLQADFGIANSQFPHVVLASRAEPLHAHDFSGRLLLHGGNFSLDDAKLTTSSGVYSVSGTASLDGNLNLKMVSEGKPGFTVTGTLLKTRVSPIPAPATQAALRP